MYILYIIYNICIYLPLKPCSYWNQKYTVNLAIFRSPKISGPPQAAAKSGEVKSQEGAIVWRPGCGSVC